tara:strand:- start:581 stop:826 length:246 start_codon:yes stop_codon:yes gene_type:complete
MKCSILDYEIKALGTIPAGYVFPTPIKTTGEGIIQSLYPLSKGKELRQLNGDLHQKLQMAANLYQHLEKEYHELVLEHRDV